MILVVMSDSHGWHDDIEVPEGAAHGYWVGIFTTNGSQLAQFRSIKDAQFYLKTLVIK